MEKLDLRGFDCPVPLIKTKNKLKEMNTGDMLEVISNAHGTLMTWNSYVKRMEIRFCPNNN